MRGWMIGVLVGVVSALPSTIRAERPVPELRAPDPTPTPAVSPSPAAEPTPSPTPCDGKFSCAVPGEPAEIVEGVLVEPAQKTSFVFELVASYGGRPVTIPVTVIRGARPGPTLLLMSTIHGDEMNGLPILLRLRERLDPEDLNGMIVMLPVVSPFGFERQTRYLPDRRDLNRYFPGNPRGSLANRIAHRIFQAFVLPSDFIVDFHTASGGRSNAPHVRADPNSEAAREVARGFGGMVVLHDAGEGTLRHAANEAGIPTAVFEAGEAGRVDPKAVEIGVRGVENLLRSRGMLASPSPTNGPPLWMHYSNWLRAETGGVVEMAVELGEFVQADQLLLTIRDTFGGERTDVRSRFPGIVMALARSPVTQPGNALIRLGLIEQDSTEKETSDEAGKPPLEPTEEEIPE